MLRLPQHINRWLTRVTLIHLFRHRRHRRMEPIHPRYRILPPITTMYDRIEILQHDHTVTRLFVFQSSHIVTWEVGVWFGPCVECLVICWLKVTDEWVQSVRGYPRTLHSRLVLLHNFVAAEFWTYYIVFNLVFNKLLEFRHFLLHSDRAQSHTLHHGLLLFSGGACVDSLSCELVGYFSGFSARVSRCTELGSFFGD